MAEPAAKRRRVERSPTPDDMPAASSLRLRAVESYATARPVAFQQPVHVAAFSYSPERELLLGEQRDAALRYYCDPPQQADLEKGFDEAVWHNDMVDEGIDALLDTLAASKLDTRAIGLITWRGMLSKLLLAAYEVETAQRNDLGRPSDPWEVNAMLVDGTLYLEHYMTQAERHNKMNMDPKGKRLTYHGYAFEAHATTSSPDGQAEEQFQVPNTNEQWCSVTKTKLGERRIIIGGEVDCVVPSRGHTSPVTSRFVELKTNLVLRNPRDELLFERQKLLKHYTQSFLLGVPFVTVGFRTFEGRLATIQTFRTLDIPKLVRDKAHAWTPQVLLNGAHEIIEYIASTIKACPSTGALQNYVDKCRREESEEKDSSFEAPVWRVRVDPRQATCSVRQLSPEEIATEVLGSKKEEKRIGFLLQRWLMRPLPPLPTPAPAPARPATDRAGQTKPSSQPPPRPAFKIKT